MGSCRARTSHLSGLLRLWFLEGMYRLVSSHGSAWNQPSPEKLRANWVFSPPGSVSIMLDDILDGLMGGEFCK